MSTKYFHLGDIERHNKYNDLWIIIDRHVYDATKFADEHPGGVRILLSVAGADASNGFKAIGHSDSAKEELEKYRIGDVHPDDARKLREPIQGTQSPMYGIVVVFVLLATVFSCLFRSIFL
ncbi:putative mitochondrial cytochrome b5-like protein [Leptomonas pyrrhocoris]|uniref:Putative mitochondrial cytochrome b5-like protein n=1 Tax=Leptomonas pyrrhocoris TaxID=157538 RepID=A0A0N0VEE5_LEPPY|nr:putative mitochondrial cytochrome b5-like protein [Leptomonas pyrrhocoris]KPA77732.1 putative mitochondrial cytochrome b5-like protein [Leptomonas pyrrhocoris]|eukprot:XP_015656171.1 putative mitochondrial cytochrome b5-like protein [Leptomonas pyrrhocoris]